MNEIIEKELWVIFNDLQKTYPSQWPKYKYITLKDFMKNIRWAYIPEYREMSPDLIKWMIARDKRRWKNIKEWERYSSNILCLILKHQKLSDKFINNFKYFDKSEYLDHFCCNEHISATIKLKIAMKYNYLEKETDKHFIEYTKVKDRVKEFENLIDNI